MKPKKILVITAVIAVYLITASFTFKTEQPSSSDSDAELSENVEDIVDNLDLTDIEAYLATLSAEQLEVIGASGIKERLKSAIKGDLSSDYSSFGSYIGSILGVNVLNCLPIIVAVITIAVAYNVLSSLRGKFASDSVKNIVYFSCVSLLIVILFTQIFVVISSVRNMVSNLQKQMSIFFPVLLTLMTAIGAGSSVAVYQPGVAILANGIAELITALILPAFIIVIVLTAVGNLSDGVKLKKLSDFFSSASKWLLGTSFFLFSAFMTVQGITASVYDGISVRAAKFAIAKYIPVIGGYLSDGLNLVMSGSVLVKNAVGATAIVLLFVSILPVVANILVLSLGLQFAGAVIEPIGDGKMSTLVSGLGKHLALLIAIVFAIAFLYFVFLILIICTGNLVL